MERIEGGQWLVHTGLREQLAAVLVEGADLLPGPSVCIHGTPGDWAVLVANGYGGTNYWLAPARQPSQIRRFKSLDAAHSAAMDVWALAHPLQSRCMAASV